MEKKEDLIGGEGHRGFPLWPGGVPRLSMGAYVCPRQAGRPESPVPQAQGRRG